MPFSLLTGHGGGVWDSQEFCFVPPSLVALHGSSAERMCGPILCYSYVHNCLEKSVLGRGVCVCGGLNRKDDRWWTFDMLLGILHSGLPFSFC